MPRDSKDKENPQETGSEKSGNKSKTLYMSLDDNLNEIKEIFSDHDGLIVRSFRNQEYSKTEFCLIYMDGMAEILPNRKMKRFNEVQERVLWNP